MNRNITNLILGLGVMALLAGCKYDNYDEPDAILHGNIVYAGQPVGVRTNGPQLELWQDGYEAREVIPVFIAHDGSYSVSLFDGEYKLVRKAGGPWVPQQADTLTISVKGTTEYDVPVTPYFTVSDESYQKTGNEIAATFTIDKVVDEGDLAEVRLYLGYSVLTDQNKNEQAQDANLADITIGQENTLSIEIPEDLRDSDYLFVRLGVRSTLSGEFYYTQVYKIEL